MTQRKFLLVSDGTKIYYEVTGEGFPLVLLHGNGSSGRSFQQLVELLRTNFRCFVIDSRGHGKSGNRARSLEFQRMSEDIREILDIEGISKAHFFGFSDGGNIAARFVVNEPGRVEKLVLNAANLHQRGLYLLVRWVSKLEIFWARLTHRNELIKDLALKETKITSEELHHITQTTLILVGQFDVVSLSYSRALAKQIPHASLRVVSFARHNFLWKSPKNYSQILLEFLENE